MTTRPMAQPGGLGPGPDNPQDDAEAVPRESKTRGTVITVVLLLLLALGVRAFIVLARIRSGRSSGKTTRPAQAPPSVIRVAAPHSVVHIVSASNLGRSHVQIPAGLHV
jgi:hypothetical protein